jgi:hypothetical protein
MGGTNKNDPRGFINAGIQALERASQLRGGDQDIEEILERLREKLLTMKF